MVKAILAHHLPKLFVCSSLIYHIIALWNVGVNLCRRRRPLVGSVEAGFSVFFVSIEKKKKTMMRPPLQRHLLGEFILRWLEKKIFIRLFVFSFFLSCPREKTKETRFSTQFGGRRCRWCCWLVVLGLRGQSTILVVDRQPFTYPTALNTEMVNVHFRYHTDLTPKRSEERQKHSGVLLSLQC